MIPMSRLENLPVDVHSLNESEEHVVSVLFQEDGDEERRPPNTNAKSHPPPRPMVLRWFEEAMMIVLLFLIFSLPSISQTIRRLSFMGESSFMMENVVKIVMIIVIYVLFKKYHDG